MCEDVESDCEVVIFAHFTIYLFVYSIFLRIFFFFKQKTAYEMRISDWSSDVCSSDLAVVHLVDVVARQDDDVLRLVAFDNVDVLGHGTGGAEVPLPLVDAL